MVLSEVARCSLNFDLTSVGACIVPMPHGTAIGMTPLIFLAVCKGDIVRFAFILLSTTLNGALCHLTTIVRNVLTTDPCRINFSRGSLRTENDLKSSSWVYKVD